jgi:epoxyqueuosine reductase QueG
VLVGDVVTIVETEECGYCTECEAVCPTGAICCPYEIVIEEYYEES